MADFAQSAASRQAMTDAARSAAYGRITSGSAKALASALGVTPRTVERWRAFVNKSGAQARNPEKALPKVAALKPVQVKIRGDYAAGGNPRYNRPGKDMPAGAPQKMPDGAAFLAAALHDPDEAYQMFFDEYMLPPGTIEDPQISFL